MCYWYEFAILIKEMSYYFIFLNQISNWALSPYSLQCREIQPQSSLVFFFQFPSGIREERGAFVAPENRGRFSNPSPWLSFLRFHCPGPCRIFNNSKLGFFCASEGTQITHHKKPCSQSSIITIFCLPPNIKVAHMGKLAPLGMLHGSNAWLLAAHHPPTPPHIPS